MVMFLRTVFGPAPAVVAVFATGIAVGAMFGSAWVARPVVLTSAAASPGLAVPKAVADASPRYPVDVTRVVDGDTFEARVRVWPGIEIATKVRLRNIEAPEIRGHCDREFALAQAARAALATMLAQGAVSISDVSLDKYGGRVLAAASTARTGDVAGTLLEAGLVRRYAGGRRASWCEGF